MEEYKVHIVPSVSNLTVEIFVVRRLPDGRVEAQIGTDEIKIFERGETVSPSLVLGEDAFRALVDAVHKDYKPSEGKYTEGKLDATERHLADLRKMLKL